MKHSMLVFVVAAGVALSLPSCKPRVKDADIVTHIEASKAGMPDMTGINATVKDGVVTLTGTVTSEATKMEAEENAKKIEGVKSVNNNITVVAPPPQPMDNFDAAKDSLITKGVNDAIKDFKSVKATVQGGVITLTGEIKRDQLPKLMQMLNDLGPKSVVNNLTVK